MKDREADPTLTRAYEIGFTNLADYCYEQIETKSAEKACANISRYIDKFYSVGIYAFVLPKDREKINILEQQIKKV